MATRQLQEEIERLRLLRKSPLDSAGIAILRKALKDRSNLQAQSAIEALQLHQESADIQERTEKAIQQRRREGLPSIHEG